MHKSSVIQLKPIENNALNALLSHLDAPMEINTLDWSFQPFTAGSTLLAGSEAGRRFVLLGAGRVRVQLQGKGPRQLTLYRIEKGGTFLHSLFNLLSEDQFTAEAIAETEGWLVWSDKRAFQRLLDDSPAFRNWLFANMSHGFAEVLARVQQLAFSPLNTRLADFLLEKLDQSSTVIATQQEIATELGTAREVINRQLAALEAKQVIERRRGVILVKDIEALLNLGD